MLKLTLKRFLRNPISSIIIWGDLKEKLLLLVGIIFFLIISGTIVALIAFNMSFQEAFWWSWTHVLDPGFLGDDTEIWQRRLFGSLFSVLGLVIVGGAFLTLAEEAASRSFERMMKGHIPADLASHTVVAGTGDKLKSFLNIIPSLPEPPSDEETVVVIPDRSFLDATREICGKKQTQIAVERIWDHKYSTPLNLQNAKRIIVLDNFGGDSGNMFATIVNIKRLRKELINNKNSNLSELKVYAEVNNRNLNKTLRSSIIDMGFREASMEVNLLNMADASARLALRDHPLDFLPINSFNNKQVALIIDGWNNFANALFWQAIRVAHYPTKPTRIIVVNKSHDEIRRDIFLTAPGLSDPRYAANIISVEFLNTLLPESLGLTKDHMITVAVCSNNPDEAFAKAFQTSELELPGLSQILVELLDGSGYREVLDNMTGVVPLYAVGSHAKAFELGEKLDAKAKKLHLRYLDQREDQGKRRKLSNGTYESKSDYDWDLLDEIRRGWNRGAADHMEVKLRVLADFHKIKRPGTQANGILEIDSALREKIIELNHNISQQDATALEDLEILARIEHDRWSAEKIAEGWSFGEQKDERRKLSPYLIPYDELTEEVKGYDRETVVEVLRDYL